MTQTTLSLTELEAAINYWRGRTPSAGEEMGLCKEAAALAQPYALMIVQGRQQLLLDDLPESARAAFLAFAAQRAA
ncbi:MAG: DUF3717 domain-containing protein [Candidatus Protistobacter heckmanni]|nr:DUF3717 domain-containing protein [Candidatus Protistobacter heckmanni]